MLMDECDVVTGLRGVLADMPADSGNGVLCGLIDELKCDVVSIGGVDYANDHKIQYLHDFFDLFSSYS
jgi:hypothetical protein